jgi:WD40 repeat protein
MIPPRRFVTLLDQARLHQISQCIYHNAPITPQHFSLYADHTCDTDLFPRITTTILQVHTDEVWSLEWSHSGKFLASASKDKSVIVWSVGVSIFSTAECVSNSLIWNSTCHSPIQILTYPCTYIYKTTNFLLDVSRGHSMIPYCCHLVSNSSRCGTQRFAKSHTPSTLDVLPHPSPVHSSERSRPTRNQSQHWLGFPMGRDSFRLPKIERSIYG